MIKKVFIKNFRSIETASFDCGDITTFVGVNDVGKSNILRALNLFFNNNTDYGFDYDFDSDFNMNARVPKNKAKEIRIELTLELPETYQHSGTTNRVVWRKVWRRNGLHEPGISLRFTDGSAPTPRSKIPALLSRITFNYVPAIKDRHYFADLQGQVYDVLSNVADTKLHKSAYRFEGEIQGYLKELISSLRSVFDVDTEMKLPKNLREIFENLEFDSDGIPLSRRGDGIKIRHIPLILLFMAKKREVIYMGVSPTIWGFEEPENNVELSACFEMAEQFRNTARNGFQIFITTHSPVFYNLGKQEDNINTYQINKHNKSTRFKPIDRENIDDEMGLMPIVAPFILKGEEQLRKRLEDKERLIDYLKNKDSVPHLFVEGETDKNILSKAVELYFNELKGSIYIYCGEKGEYGSANAVTSRAIAWHKIHKHKVESVKGAALFDKDEEGINAKKELSLSIKDHTKHVKAFFYEGNERLGKLLKSGYHIPIDLEALYPDNIWEYAESQGWIAKVENITKRLSDKKVHDAIHDGKDILHSLNEHDKRRVAMCFTDDGKEEVVKHILKLENEVAKEVLFNLKRSLEAIFKYFEQ